MLVIGVLSSWLTVATNSFFAIRASAFSRYAVATSARVWAVHVWGIESTRRPPVQIERAQAPVVVAQGKGEHRHESLGQRTPDEHREPGVVREDRHRDGPIGLVRRQARPFAQ